MHPKVIWQEGLLLTPQHLQQAFNASDQLARELGLNANSFLWGIDELVIDELALTHGRIRVARISGRFADGTPFVWDEESEPERVLEVDLNEAFEGSGVSQLCVHIRLPKAIGQVSGESIARYQLQKSALIPDEFTQAQPVSIDVGVHNLSLVCGEVPSQAFDFVTIACVERQNDVFKLDRDFIFPANALSSDHNLLRRLLMAANTLKNKGNDLNRNSISSGGDLEAKVKSLEARFRVAALMRASAEIYLAINVDGVHPFTLYTAMHRARTELALLIFGKTSEITARYNHAKPSDTLLPLVELIEQMVATIANSYTFKLFEWNENRFEIELESNESAALMIGIKATDAINLEGWLSTTVICWASDLERHRSVRIVGFQRRILGRESLPEELFSSGYQIVEVQVEAKPSDTTIVVCPSLDEHHYSLPEEVVCIAEVSSGLGE